MVLREEFFNCKTMKLDDRDANSKIVVSYAAISSLVRYNKFQSMQNSRRALLFPSAVTEE